MRLILVIFFVFSAPCNYALTFSDAIKNLKEHDVIAALRSKAKALNEEGKSKGSWGDPMLVLAAKNFPKETLKDNETPMTGVEVQISQKIALTTKYAAIKESYQHMGKSSEHDSESKMHELVKSFWDILIEDKKIDEEIKIFEENLDSINGILKVSKRLYTNGKISQQALFDIQIRKSELEASLSNKRFESQEQQDMLAYLLGYADQKLLKDSIPWKILTTRDDRPNDPKELSLQSQIYAKTTMLTAKKLAYIPDLTFSIGLTKRADIDRKGDFVSAMVAFPLPFSGQKYADHSQSIHEKSAAEKQLVNYQRYRLSESNRLKHEIEKLTMELDILNRSTIRYSENSKKITSKSYGLGGSTYSELLQSELKLQNLLIKKSNLVAMLLKLQVKYKFLIGEKLYE